MGGPGYLQNIKKYLNSVKSILLLPMCIGMSRMGEETMIYMKHGLPKKERNFKIINVFPLKTSVIPGYIDIDTIIVIRLLFDETENKSYYQKNGNLLSKNKEIWYKIFNMDHKIFKMNGYVFNRRISTNGFW